MLHNTRCQRLNIVYRLQFVNARDLFKALGGNVIPTADWLSLFVWTGAKIQFIVCECC